MITPKDEFIKRVLEIMCKHCSRRIRVEKRLRAEISENGFDFDRQMVVDKIMQEEM